MDRIFFLTILFLLILSGCRKKEVSATEAISNDSLTLYLNRVEDNSLSQENRLAYNYKAFALLQRGKKDSTSRKKILKVAVQFYNLNEFSDFKRATYYGLEESEKEKDTLNAIRAYMYLAQFARDTGKNDSAYIFYRKSEELAHLIRDYESLANASIKIAFIQSDINDFSGAELSASKTLNYIKHLKDKSLMYYAYNVIGISSNEMKSYNRALEYHQRALKTVTDSQEKDNYHLAASSMNNIGVVYQNMNNHLKAIEFFEMALDDSDLYKDNPGLYAILIDNLAYSKFKSNDFKNLPSLFFKSLKIRDSLDLKSGVVVNKIHLSEYYALLKDTVNSRKYAMEALSMARKSNFSGDILGSLNQIFLVDNTNSTKYYKEYIKISDSLQQAERRIKDRFDRIRFETDEISSEKDKLEEQNRNLLYIFIGTLTIGMLLFVIRTQRAKNRELMLKQAQQKANEDIYNLMISQQNTIEESRTREKKRIAQELHDGVLGRLFGARLNLDSLNRQATDAAADKRSQYLTELKNIEQDIREISHDLNREKYVLINNFVAILNNLLEEQQNSFDPELTASIDESIKWDQIENTAKINLYRIIQESLQNINKYANATAIRMEIKKSAENIVLTVTDNGDGFTVGSKKKGIGLQNMISRTHELNGTFDIRSKKGKGTTIMVTFPLE